MWHRADSKHPTAELDASDHSRAAAPLRCRTMTLPDALQGIPALPSGDDFEAFVWSLLQRRYPPEELRYFPAAMGGDKGLEGFSTDGIGYQCYADKDSLTLRARTDKQKAKSTRDTNKLKKNRDALIALLDGTVLNHYFLIVPQYHSTEVIEHANKRSELVRSWGLPFISESSPSRRRPHRTTKGSTRRHSSTPPPKSYSPSRL